MSQVQAVRATDEFNWIYSTMTSGSRSRTHQYIETKTGDRKTLDEIAPILQRKHRAKPKRRADKDFAPVMQALDEMFRRLGWPK